MKVILDLCGGTGSWSNPYARAGYEVLIVDPLAEGPRAIRSTVQELARLDLRPGWAHGILCAPPCTQFAASGARWWAGKDPALLADGLACVRACLEVVARCAPAWWALENPVGRLPSFIGPYRYTFQPTAFGDPWHKRTCIWGAHVEPARLAVPVKHDPARDPWRLSPSPERWRLRSKTPPGFAQAFFEANP